jgi:hypothetical protein
LARKRQQKNLPAVAVAPPSQSLTQKIKVRFIPSRQPESRVLRVRIRQQTQLEAKFENRVRLVMSRATVLPPAQRAHVEMIEMEMQHAIEAVEQETARFEKRLERAEHRVGVRS